MSVDIEKLARLARVELTEDEKTSFGPQIAEILTFVDQLSQLDTEGVEPMTSALDVENRFRDDLVSDSLTPEVATAMSPSAAAGYFQVPAVLGTAATGKKS